MGKCQNVYIYYIILNANTPSTLRLVSKETRSSENLRLYFVLRKFKRSHDASRQTNHPLPRSITC